MNRLLIFSITFFAVQLNVAFADDNPFIEGGIPATSRDWHGIEYLATSKAIQSQKVPIPLLKDEYGKRVIMRLTNTENFALSKNTSLSLDLRLQDYLQILQGVTTILGTYVSQANQGEALHEEVAILIAFSLRTGAVGVDLVEELLPTLAKDDKYEVRMQGLKKMRRGLTTMFAGAETSLTEKKFYSDDDLTLIISAMHDTLPIFKPGFSPEYRHELNVKLKGHKKKFVGKDLILIEKLVVDLNTE